MCPLLCLIVLLISASSEAGLSGPLSADFQAWLGSHGYAISDFTRPDLQPDSIHWASYGGRRSGNESTLNPIIFVHGNSDSALANPNAAEPTFATGWDASIGYFLSHGYGPGQLYATTWGPANSADAGDQIHSCDYLHQLRRFFQAVLDYTKAPKVDVISHSMGVTLSRRVLLGGSVTDSNGASCNLGPPLTSKVDTFVGIAGGNHGLCSCAGLASTYLPTCNTKDGFDPGSCSFFEQNCFFNLCSQDSVVGMSAFLKSLNSQPNGYEGDFRYFIYSLGDDVILNGDNCYGHPTSTFPHATGGRHYDALTHMESKDLTAAQQFRMVTLHQDT